MKLPEYNENDFEEQHFFCPNCQWKGEGYDVVIIDFFGVSKSKEVHCPNCDTTIAIITKAENGDAGESAAGFSVQTG